MRGSRSGPRARDRVGRGHLDVPWRRLSRRRSWLHNALNRGPKAPAKNDTHEHQTRANEQVDQRFHYASQAGQLGTARTRGLLATQESSRGTTLVHFRFDFAEF